MTPLPKHLEEIRDASANDYSNQQIKFYHSVCRDEYKAGFNQAASILLKDMEVMAKAVHNVCKEQSIPDFELHVHELREALKIWKDKYEVKK